MSKRWGALKPAEYYIEPATSAGYVVRRHIDSKLVTVTVMWPWRHISIGDYYTVTSWAWDNGLATIATAKRVTPDEFDAFLEPRND